MASANQIDSRQLEKQSALVLKRMLNSLQAETLRTVEQVGWTIRFLRPQPGGQSLAVVYDPDRQAYAVIEPTGRLVENPEMSFR